MNETTIKGLENYYLKKLKDIDDYIDTIEKTPIEKTPNYEEKRMYTIMKLDKIEKEIMTRDWSNNDYIKRTNFRPVIYNLYKKLDSCPPKRNKQDFERKYIEPYQDPVYVSKCPESDELYTQTTYDLKKSIPITNKHE